MQAPFRDRQAVDSGLLQTFGPDQILVFHPNEQLIGTDKQAEAQSRLGVEESTAKNVHVKKPPEPRHGDLRGQAILDKPAPCRAVAEESSESRPRLDLSIKLARFKRRVTIMLGNVMFQPAQILMAHQRSEMADRAVDDH